MIECLANIFMLNIKLIKAPNKDTQINLEANKITKRIETLQLNLETSSNGTLFKGTSAMS